MIQQTLTSRERICAPLMFLESNTTLPTFGSVEKRCGYSLICLQIHSLAVLNLNRSLEFSSSLPLSTFCLAKSCKNARHRQNQSQQPFAHESPGDIPRLAVVCHQILSFCFWVVRNSFSQPLAKRASNQQSDSPATRSKNRMGFVCDFDGAGFSL